MIFQSKQIRYRTIRQLQAGISVSFTVDMPLALLSGEMVMLALTKLTGVPEAL